MIPRREMLVIDRGASAIHLARLIGDSDVSLDTRPGIATIRGIAERHEASWWAIFPKLGRATVPRRK